MLPRTHFDQENFPLLGLITKIPKIKSQLYSVIDLSHFFLDVFLHVICFIKQTPQFFDYSLFTLIQAINQ